MFKKKRKDGKKKIERGEKLQMVGLGKKAPGRLGECKKQSLLEGVRRTDRKKGGTRFSFEEKGENDGWHMGIKEGGLSVREECGCERSGGIN